MKRLTRLANRYKTDKGTMHGDAHGYTEFYQQFLEKYENPNILELGTYLGGGTRMFSSFYDGDCNIWCVDWAPQTTDFIRDIPNVNFIQVDLGKVEQIQALHEQLKDIKFDIIIDDASHIWQQQMDAMYYLNDLLSDKGIYILEDIHFSRLFYDSEQSPLFFISLMKPVCTLSEEQNEELLNKIDTVQIFSRKNVSTQDMVEKYGGRSITSIITFENKN